MPMHSPSHPGLIIKDDLEALNLTITKAAEKLGVDRSQISRVTTGKCAISPEMAIRLETVLGGSAEHLLRMQAAYDLAQVRQAKAKAIRNLQRLQPA